MEDDDDDDRFGVTYFNTDRKRHTKKRMMSFSRNSSKILILGDVIMENKMFWGKKEVDSSQVQLISLQVIILMFVSLQL